MGRRTRRFLGVVAAIAVPFAAPAVAAAIGVSSTVGIAATGAALGATAAAATGGDPLMGAVVGGVGSYLNAPSPTTTTPAGTGLTTSATGTSGITAPGVTPTTAAVPSTITTMPTTDYSNILSQGVSAGGEGFSLAGGTTGFTGAGAGAAGLNYSDFGTQLSGPTTSTSAASGLGSIDYGFTTTPSAGFSAPGIPISSPSAPTASLAGGVPGAEYGLTTGGTLAAASPMATAAAPVTAGGVPGAAAQQAAATAPLTAGQKALEFTKSIGGDLIKTAAMVYALGAGNVPGEIPADQMAMYEEELRRLAEQNPQAYQAQLNEAQKFLQQAEALDPDYFGQQRARSEQIRGARQKSAGLRGLTGRQRAAAERQYDIATGRAAGTAYESGAQTALTGQIQTRQAGLALMPKPSEYSTLSSLQNLGGIYRDQATARRQYAQDIGGLADLGAGIYDKGRSIYG